MILVEPPKAIEYCADCEATGHVWRHGIAHDGADYAIETNALCPECGGAGVVEFEPQQLTCEEA